MTKFMNNSQLIIAIILTTISVLGVLSQQLWHNIVIDNRTIFLIALGTLPWLTFFFKKFKIPGFEGESHDRDQSKTDRALPPNKDAVQNNTTGEISSESKKILVLKTS